MIPETNKIIEKFLLGELIGKELDDFHIKMKKSAELASEVKLNQDIVNSILEQDVIDLRTNLRNICSDSQNKEPLARNLFDFTQNLSAIPNQNEFSDAISTTENSLQLIHLETHLKCTTERVHQISSKTDPAQELILSNQITDFIFEEEIKDAILEKDIIELRTNLREIISSGYINFSDFEIDQYRSNELSQTQIQEFLSLIADNTIFDKQLKLHKDIDTAINEKDVLSLRNSLAAIIHEEQQISYEEIRRIDDYLLEYLNEKDREEFESELFENIKFKKETILHSEINDAIIESDVLKLRNNLLEIIEENKQLTKIRRFIPNNFKNKKIRYISVAASAAAVISTGLFTLSQQNSTAESIFQQAYLPYEAAGFLRSAPLASPSFKGIELYNERKYDEAISQFELVLNEKSLNPMSNFYTGLCYMEKGNYDKAIVSFKNVIVQKDNLFTELAEWYTALSFLKTNDKKDAYDILNKIVENKGYNHKSAKELLKKLK